MTPPVLVLQKPNKSATRTLCDFRISGKERIYTIQLTVFVWENEKTESKASREKVKVDITHLFGAKIVVHHRRISPKNVENVFSYLSEYLSSLFCFSICVWCFWKLVGQPICRVQNIR